MNTTELFISQFFEEGETLILDKIHRNGFAPFLAIICTTGWQRGDRFLKRVAPANVGGKSCEGFLISVVVIFRGISIYIGFWFLLFREETFSLGWSHSRKYR